MSSNDDGILISAQMLAAMAERGYALVLVDSRAVRFVHPETGETDE